MDKMNKTDKINKVEKILEEMVRNKENNEENTEIEEFLSKETMDDVYKFFLKKDPSITIDEFDNCVAQMLELSINKPEIEPLDNDKIDKIVGGANILNKFGSKMTSMLLAALTLLPGISSMASASAVDTHTAAGEGHKSSIAEKCCQMKDTVESLSKSGFNNISNFVKKHPWITTGICAAMLAATGTAIAMKNRNSRADKSNQENKSEVKQSGNKSVTQSNDSKKSEVKENNDDSAHSGAPAPGLNKGLLAQIQQAGKELNPTSPNTDSKKHEVQAKDNNDNEDRARAVAELDKKLEKKQEGYGKNDTPSRDPLIATIANDPTIKRLKELNKHDEEDDEDSNNPAELNNDNSASQDTDSKQADGDMSQVSNTPAPPPPPPFPNIKPSTDSKKPEVKAKANNDNSAPSGAPASGQNQDLLAQIKAGIKLKPTSVKKKQEEYGKNNTSSGDSLIAKIAENPTIDTMLGKVKPVEVDDKQTTDGDWETHPDPEGKMDQRILNNDGILKDRPESWTGEARYDETDKTPTTPKSQGTVAKTSKAAKPKSGPSNTTPRPLPTPKSTGQSGPAAKPVSAHTPKAAQGSAKTSTAKPKSGQANTTPRPSPTPKSTGQSGPAAKPSTTAQPPKAQPSTASQPSTTAHTSVAKTSTSAQTSTTAHTPVAKTSTVESQSKTKEERITDLENQIKQLEEEKKPYERRLGHFFRTEEEKSKEKELKQKINNLQDQINILKSN